MNAPVVRRGRAPEVDEGDARDLVALLRRELRPTPGRLGDCLRIVLVLLSVIAIAETFRISEIALSGYIVLFVSGREAVTTILTALLAGIAVVLAIFVTIAVFMLSLSEPALRIPLMALATFAAAFLARTATLGPVFFTVGFIIAYGLTFGDELLGLALQPATSGNAAQYCSQVARVAFVHIRRPAATLGMPVHLSITTTAVAPKRIRSSGGASSRMRTGKRAAIRTQFKVRSTCGRPPNVALTSDATPQPRLSTWPRSARLGCAIT